MSAVADKVIITQGKYLASAVKPEQYPELQRKEVVFIGRSNVGKSSLINSLTRVRNLARVSSQPGKTQTINFYEIGAKIHPDSLITLHSASYLLSLNHRTLYQIIAEKCTFLIVAFLSQRFLHGNMKYMVQRIFFITVKCVLIRHMIFL